MAWPTDWGRKVVITVQAAMADTNLSYFPILITAACIPSEVLDTTTGNECQADGGDLRFYTGDYSASNPGTENTDRLPCEIVSLTRAAGAGGTCEIWVRVPSINASTGAIITMFYNSNGQTQPAEGAAYGKHETWNENSANNFKMVHHLTGASATALDDSTSYNNDVASAGGTPTYNVTGAFNGGTVGQGSDLDGTGDYFSCGADASLEATSAITISAWVYAKALALDDSVDIIYSKSDNILEGGIEFGLERVGNSNYLSMAYYDGSARGWYTDSNVVSINAWHHVVMIWNQNNVIYVKDGVQLDTVDTANNAIVYDTDTALIGAQTQNDEFNGDLDEVRVAAVVRAVDWIEAEYRNQSAPGTYVVEGTPGDVAAGGFQPAWARYSNVILQAGNL